MPLPAMEPQLLNPAEIRQQHGVKYERVGDGGGHNAGSGIDEDAVDRLLKKDRPESRSSS